MSFGAWGAIADGIASLLTTPMQNYYNKKAQSSQNKLQWQFWQANNDYNSPVSVMQRLEEANLNPNLVYQNGGASYQATMPTAAKRSPVDVNIRPMNFQQLENMEAQRDLITQQLNNSKTQNRILDANARIAEKDAQIYEDTGVRPGDSPLKTLWRNIADWFTLDDSSTLGHAVNETKKDIRRVNADKRPYSMNNSAGVKFYD